MIVRLPVWIDTDPTVVPGGYEVDDGFAIALAFRSPELSVVGVSTIFGNGDLDCCHASAETLVAAFGPSGMPVHRGAACAGEVIATAATRALIAAARAMPLQSLTILALGPLTNIAAAVSLAPDITDKIRSIIWVAGRLPGQEFRASADQIKAFPDLNFEKDAGAAAAVLASAIPIAMTSWAVCSQVHVTQAHLIQQSHADAATRILHQPARDWLNLWSRQFAVDYFMPFDTLAVAHACGIGGIKGFDGRAWIEPGAPPRLYVADRTATSSSRPVWFATDVEPQFIDQLMTRITSPAHDRKEQMQ